MTVVSCPACSERVEDGLRFCPHCGFQFGKAKQARRDPMLGRTIAGNFRLLDTIGQGAMGTIYRAEQLSLGKTVVIKLLHRHLLGDKTLSKRFHREARAASMLNHPNVIQIIDFGQADGGLLYIAMEYVPGRDLAEVLFREYPLDSRRAIHLLRQTCFALDEAHANGVLHRDLKPENIMVSDRRNMTDFVKVLDFGIAKLQDSDSGPNTFQTVAGVVCGTPEYMSPEQARGEKLDGRTDLYALGVIVYQLLTNQLPFEADSALGVVTKHLSEKPVPPTRYAADVPRGLEALCLTLLAKDRRMRPTSALDVAAELDRLDREIEASRLRLQSVPEVDKTVVDMRAAHVSDAMPPRTETPRQVEQVTDQQRAVTGPTAAVSPPDPTVNLGITGDDHPLTQGPGRFARRPPPVNMGMNVKMLLLAVAIGAAVALLGWALWRLFVPQQFDAGHQRTGAESGEQVSPPAPSTPSNAGQ